MNAKITRRRAVGLMAAAPFFPSAAAGAAGAGRELRFGIVGCGAWGLCLCSYLLREIKGRAPVRVRALCDIRECARETVGCLVRGRSGAAPNLYSDYGEMLEGERGNLDAVVVATPDWMHEPHAAAALAAGLHVYCESPLAHNSQSARAIVRAARGSPKIFRCASFFRDFTFMEQLWRHFTGGDALLGPLLSAGSRVYYYPHFYDPPPSRPKRMDLIPPRDVLNRYGYASGTDFLNWRYQRKYCLGYDLQWAAAQADFFRDVLDSDPVALTASGGACGGIARAEAVFVNYEFGGGPSGKTWCRSAYFPYSCPNLFTNRIRGRYGSVEFSLGSAFAQSSYDDLIAETGTDAAMDRLRAERDGVKRRWEAAYEKGILGKGEEQKGDPDGYVPGPFDRDHTGKFILPSPFSMDFEVDGFVDAVRAGRRPARGSAEDGCAAVLIAEKIRESMRTGRRIAFPGDFFRL